MKKFVQEKEQNITEERTVPLSVVIDLMEYISHGSWRCAYYQECHCGLDDILKNNNLPPIPIPGFNADKV